MAPEAAAASARTRLPGRVPGLLLVFLLQVFRPAEAAARIHARQRWLGAFALLAAGHILVSALALPASIDATLAHLPESANDADRLAVASMLEQEQLVRSLFLPIRLGAAWAVYALWVVFLCRAFSRNVLPRYRAILGLVVHAELFGLLARAAALVRHRWWPSVEPARDLLPPFSLADLLPPALGHLPAVAASFVNPFSAMSLVTLGLGLCAACGFRPLKGFALALFAWAGGAAGLLGLLYVVQIMLHGAP